MIRKDENVTMISGEITKVLTEMTDLLRVLYKNLNENLGKEEADEMFVKLGKLAVMSEEEITNELENEKKGLN